jgi:glycosyltransferase involved in cell wall biosynthesis
MFNEESIVFELVTRVKNSVEKITNSYEIILVDDGSTDKTWDKIIDQTNIDHRVKGIRFSRNFGHHYAITAGLEESIGDWVVVMDGDLQDTPEVIPNLYSESLKGFDVVFVSRKNRPESLAYKILQKVFYKILTILSGIKWNSRQANFSIISRKVVEAFKLFPENARFYGSTIKWLGFKTSSIEADHGRRFSGKPSYTFKKRIKLALDIIIAFSERPLRFAVSVGIFMSSLSLISFVLIVNDFFIVEIFIKSQLWFIPFMLFLFGFLFFLLGVIGIYLGRVFSEVKKRPLYIISEKSNYN